jgi:hypothetical protein
MKMKRIGQNVKEIVYEAILNEYLILKEFVSDND